MEEKKLDVKSIIGFVLIFVILIGWFYLNQPTPEELEAQKAQQEQVVAPVTEERPDTTTTVLEQPQVDLKDSLAVANYQKSVGDFSYTPVREGVTVLENDRLYLEINNKGGQITEARMKQFVTYDSIPVYLVKEGNADFGLSFTTTDNRVLQTNTLFFEPQLSQNGDNQVLSMRAKVSENQFLEYRYEMKPDDYLLDFTIRSRGLN
ncbi:MAG: YidC/Oxa1 family insertase periplasmic-domain containing protein, partial [Eudoraea sp.]|nr:YidC/Oxa1 family insertase periplasmic-domain containing protein [Eudoraea sp.]NNK30033.1 membrane protein insertase YidC [Flavobacteriaceae bacterium]